MPVRVGDVAPDFTAVSDDGRTVHLSALRGSWVVLFFYPKAGSAGCATEAGAFEAASAEFARRGAHVIGVSTDTEATQAKFRMQCRLTYPLIPDGEQAVSGRYGVVGGLMGLFGRTSRVTFLIDAEGRVRRMWHPLNVMAHARQVLTAIDDLERAASS